MKTVFRPYLSDNGPANSPPNPKAIRNNAEISQKRLGHDARTEHTNSQAFCYFVVAKARPVTIQHSRVNGGGNADNRAMEVDQDPETSIWLEKCSQKF